MHSHHGHVLLHVIYCMSAGLIWFQIDWSKLCSTNSLCNMSKDKLSSHYLVDILVFFVKSCHPHWMFESLCCISPQLHHYIVIKENHIFSKLRVDWHFNGASILFLGCCHAWDNLVTMGVIVMIQFHSVNCLVRHSVAGYQRISKVLTFSPWKTPFSSLSWLKIVGLNFNSSVSQGFGA